MDEPWNIKKDDARQADSLPNFIIFCEDEVTEPIYFKYFETDSIKVNPIKNQKSKIDNVIKAICYCEEQGLLDTNEEGIFLPAQNTQIWCVFDRDIESNPSDAAKQNVSFDMAIDAAKKRGFKVAWSNDAFELWVLLHFENVDPKDVTFKNRSSYYIRLTEIFKNIPEPIEDLQKVLRHPSYNYKRDLKSENNFRNIVRKEIVTKTTDAIQRAKVLEEFHAKSKDPNHKKSPCTYVHHLVEELLALGGKKI